MVNRIMYGIVVIIVGILLLLNTTHYLPWSVWNALTQYWPLIIIGLGVEIVCSKRRVPGVALALILALILAAMYPYPGLPGWPFTMFMRQQDVSSSALAQSQQIKVPLDSGVSKLEVKLVAPSLDVTSRGDKELAVQGAEYAIVGDLKWDRHQPVVETTTRGGSAIEVSIASPVREGRGAGKQKWDLRFHPSLATEMEITAGAAELRLDMVSHYVEMLNLSAGVADVEIDFGLSGQRTIVNIAAGVADVELYVPEAAGVKVTVEAPPFIARVRTDDLGLVKQGNSWVSKGFSDASTRIEVNVACGAGNVHIRKAR